MKERTRIKYKDAVGKVSTAYAILTDEDYIWCFDNASDKYGYTIHKGSIVSPKGVIQ